MKSYFLFLCLTESASRYLNNNAELVNGASARFSSADLRCPVADPVWIFGLFRPFYKLDTNGEPNGPTSMAKRCEAVQRQAFFVYNEVGGVPRAVHSDARFILKTHRKAWWFGLLESAVGH